ncbi:MAG: hypothetical protein QOF76_186 [Solirubrobacteraceae bacterium]|nr:hypothetical protein [Solirubrobacteraceae bacterium]
MFVPPSPVPISADRPVVAGPVLSEHRMVWVQSVGAALVVRAQGPAGRVTTVARLGVPAMAPGMSVTDSVGAFAVRGREIALTRSLTYNSVVPCVAPAPYACVAPTPPPVPFHAEYARGEFGHVRTVASTNPRAHRCRVPDNLAFSDAGLVVSRCGRISVGGRQLANAIMTGARGPWVAWQSNHSNAVVVRRVVGKPRRYRAPGASGGNAKLGGGGSVLEPVAVGGDGLCGTGTIVGVQISTPQLPGPGPLVRDIFGAAGGSGSAFAVSHATADCPPRFEPAVLTTDGTITPVGPATDAGPARLAIDAEEVAVLGADGLRRYAR